MSPFDQELVDFCQQRMIQQAQAAQRAREVQTTRNDLHHRILIHAGDSLITLGLKLKNLSTPDSDQEYTSLYT